MNVSELSANELREALGIVELPVGSPPPAITPPEGTIVPYVESDGWTRKYLYRTGMGSDGRPRQSRIMISEIPPAPGTAPAPVLPFLSGPVRAEGDGLQVPANSMAKPTMVQLSGGRKLGPTGLGQAFPIGGGTLPAGQPKYPGDNPGVLNSPVVNPPQAAPAQPEPVCPDGPIQLKNGDFLAPDDPVTLANLCEIMPVIAEALEIVKRNRSGQGQGGNRTGPVTVQGGIPGASQGVPTSMSPFASQQQGVAAGNGAGGGFGGGGRGGPGPQGAQGAVGAGGISEFITKTDGNFIAGAGAFIVVPGTTITFTVVNADLGFFYLQATFGATDGSQISQSGQIGLRIDGVDYPLSTRLIHTGGGGNGEFLVGQTSILPLNLSAGAHQVDVVLRGLTAGEFGGGLASPVGVCAVPDVPLHLSVIHS